MGGNCFLGWCVEAWRGSSQCKRHKSSNATIHHQYRAQRCNHRFTKYNLDTFEIHPKLRNIAILCQIESPILQHCLAQMSWVSLTISLQYLMPGSVRHLLGGGRDLLGFVTTHKTHRHCHQRWKSNHRQNFKMFSSALSHFVHRETLESESKWKATAVEAEHT